MALRNRKQRVLRPQHDACMYFENIVFCGGGNRCFWQAGFWSALAPTLHRQPTGVVAVSAGAAMACALFSSTFAGGFEAHKRAVSGNPSNLNVGNLLKAKPLFPHGTMYRDAILASIDDGALSRLHAGPEINIVVSRPPPWARGRLALLLGAVSLGMDAWQGDNPDAPAARRMGFRPVYVPVRECKTPDALADLILASSCVPPLIPLALRSGMPALDGGLVANVPTDLSRKQGGRTLVLLTRRFARLPTVPGHTFVQPSAPISVGTWDYTNHRTLQAAFDLGQSDGVAYAGAEPVSA